MSGGYKQSQLRNIPKEWTVSTIEKEASICTGGKDTQDKIEDGIYPFFVRSNTIERINSYSFDGEAVLTSGDGVGVGKIYHYLNCKFDYHQRVYNIHNFSEKLNGRFFYYFFSNHFYERVMRLSAKNSVDSVRRSMISDMEIPLPPLQEQQKIAEILSTVDAKIEVIDQQITETQALKKGLMQQLLSGRWSVIEKRPLSSAEMKDSPLGEIPKSWEVVRIGDLGNVVTGSTPKTSVDEFYAEEGILWASPSDLTNIKYVNTTKKKLSPLGFEQTRKLPPKSILVTCIGSTIGKIGMTNSWMSTNQQINSIVCSDLNDSEFYYYVIEKNVEAIKSMAGTQAVPLLNKTDFSNVLVIKPNLIEQQKISEILSSIDDKLEVLSEKKMHYQELKQGLMQQLLTGKVRVNINNSVNA